MKLDLYTDIIPFWIGVFLGLTIRVVKVLLEEWDRKE